MEWDYGILNQSGYSIARVKRTVSYDWLHMLLMCRIQEMHWMR